MNEKLISSFQIEKLGHKILEIRERALFNIISKLDNGILFDNDLARSKELLSKLFQWFLFEPCSYEDVVLNLIKRILITKSGNILINHYGKPTIVKELKQIRTYIEPKYYESLDSILELLNNLEEAVPPLQSDLPLSYRTENSEPGSSSILEGFVHKDTSPEQQHGINITSSTYRITSTDHTRNLQLLKYYLLEWQPLVEPDLHVLQSVEQSLTQPPQPSALIHTCEFFCSVVLHDFPAEVFIQRPSILFGLQNLVENCSSTRVANAALKCLYDLTKALQVRINQCNDPCLRNLKNQKLTDIDLLTTPDGTNRTSEPSEKSQTYETLEDLVMLKKSQITIPKYCYTTALSILKFLCVKPESIQDEKLSNFNIFGANTALISLKEILTLLEFVISSDVWDQTENPVVVEIANDFGNFLSKFGEALDHFRLEATSSENNLNSRVIYLYLLHVCVFLLKKFVGLSKTGLILPRVLKSALSNSLLDVSMSRLYPKVHEILLEYVESFSLESDLDHIKNYKSVKKVCEGITASVQLLKNYKTTKVQECLNLAKISLPSVEFHRNLTFLKIFIEICSDKLGLFSEDDNLFKISENITVSLLAYNVPEIREELYRLCQSVVISAVGPKLNTSKIGVPGSKILFLLNHSVLNEIVQFGIMSENPMIRSYAENIINHILKCKILVSETIWNKTVEALIPTFPVICCHADKQTTLGRIIVNILDPDTAKDMSLPKISTLKSNIVLLFGNNSALREEAFSRLCWLLATEDKSRDLLPRITNLYDKALAQVCQQNRVVDLNKSRHTQHFYQPSSLYQVMEVLKSTNIEPVIRRSALTQVAVMVEDPLLHQVFLDMDGLAIVTDVMRVALTEQDYRDYPDSVIPAISILRHLSLYHSNVRENLCNDYEVLTSILRGIFLFFTEERVKQDGSILLFLLVFKDFITGSPTKGNVTVANLIQEKLNLPFVCNTQSKESQFTKENLLDFITADRWSLSSMQIQWNVEVFGFDNLLKSNSVNYDETDIDTPQLLKLSAYDLRCLKNSSVEYCVEKYLNDIQNGTSHSVVKDAIEKLILYVYLFGLHCTLDKTVNVDSILAHNWERTFQRFLKVLPSSEEDAQLLKRVIQFLKVLVTRYKGSEKECWILTFLKDPTQNLLDLITVDNNTNEEMKMLSEQLLELISLCACQEQHYFDYHIRQDNLIKTDNKSWPHIVSLLIENLKFNDTEHFYNLAYLDSTLSCLANLTASLGWSCQKSNSLPKEPVRQLVRVLCEMVIAFHCGKGVSAAVSVMGLSITRHVMLVLNHVLAELHHTKTKNWETCFLDNLDEEPNIFQSFMTLWASRDVVLRAAVLQLFSSMATSSTMAMEIVRSIKYENGETTEIWDLGLRVLLDHSEASIVRENSALLLANLTSHIKENIFKILIYLKEFDFFNQLEILLNNFFIFKLKDVWNKGSLKYDLRRNSFYSDTSSVSSENQMIGSTPSLVKSVTIFLYNILDLAPEDFSKSLQENGLIKLLFRCVCNPCISVSNTKELSLYCDLLEMNYFLCCFLTKTATCSSSCLGTILHTKDCFNVLVSLLNPKIYHNHLPQLIYLRNKLWTEIFTLLTTLVDLCTDDLDTKVKPIEALSIFSDTLSETGSEPFLETLCESISCTGFKELQSSALVSLTALLRIESYRLIDEPKLLESNESLQNLLDNVKSPRSFVISDDDCVENEENIDPKLKKKSEFNIKLLEECYFGKMLTPKISSVKSIEDKGFMMGEEICKILLYLLEVTELKVEKDFKNKSTIIAALSNIICVSQRAKLYALRKGLMAIIVKKLKELTIKLSLDSAECLRKASDKKRVSPLLKELIETIGLLTNFMYDNEEVKVEAANYNVADFIHKLWVWFLTQTTFLIDVLKMICTFTTNCALACQSLPSTSPSVGSGPKKGPSNFSLLHAIINVVCKEMEQISKTHNLTVLELSFAILQNCCSLLECRILITKSNLLQSIYRLHPALTKRQKPWSTIELMWLEFLQTFTATPEGQTNVAKVADVLDIVMCLTSSAKCENRQAALCVLRNLSFYQPNKSRLLSSAEFLNILQSKLENGNSMERNTVVLIMWSLAANSQKAKLILKSAQLDVKLQRVIKQYQLVCEATGDITKDNLQRMNNVLNMLRDSDKSR